MNRQLVISVVPAILVGIVFEIFLTPRHDYTGHFAAGYGATLAATIVWLKTINAANFRRYAVRSIVASCLVCILLGVIAEATIFRIAKFDEVDFFNQSLGAVLASVASIAFACKEKPPDMYFDHVTIVAIVFLGLGGCFAVA